MMVHRGGHPAQVIGKSGPAFEEKREPREVRPNPWHPWEGEEGGWVGPGGEWRPDKPPEAELPPRDEEGRFTT